MATTDEALEKRGAGPATERCTLTVEGMDCAGCAATVEGSLLGVDGVRSACADVVGGRVSVEYTAGRVTPADLVVAVRRKGYGATEAEAGRRPIPDRPRQAGRLVLVVVSGILWAGSLAAEVWLGGGAVAAVLALGAIATGGRYIVPRGIRAAMDLALDMNFLMTIAAFGAVALGEFGEAASAMFLFAVAQLLESHSMDRARNAIAGLMELTPSEATVLRGGREVRVGAEEVRVGEVVVVRPGEKLAVDGEVVAGRSGVNQAPITGESIPVEKEPGSEVFAGTLNGSGALEVRSTKPASDTTLARIVESVEQAQATRAPSQQFVDRFARVYTPAVVAAAVLVATVPPVVGLGGWGEWFYRALVLLVVACPCALVISTPVTVVSALAGAARRGILIKGGLHLENAGRAKAVAFDKTGTLTKGEPAVVEVVGFGQVDAREALTLAAAAEARSEHPLAQAIRRRAEEEGIATAGVEDTQAVSGRGVHARVNGVNVTVGSPKLFPNECLTPDALEVVARHEAEGRTVALVGAAVAGAAPPVVRGAIAIADQIRPGAADALRELRRAGIGHIAMLTGDNAASAASLAGQLRLDAYSSALLPEEKVAAVHRLRDEHGTVLMVGDGINDAPALAAADVGIAMGSAGTDIALETADIALMADDLSRVATTIRLARKAERIIRANIWFSLLTKAVFLVLAVLGVATLWMAVIADMGASLAVVLNGLRALEE